MLSNSKLHIDRREAEVNMNCLLFNYISCSPKQKSTIVILYKRYISVEKSLLCSRFNAKFGRRYFTNHVTLRRYVTDYATSLEATSSSMRH